MDGQSKNNRSEIESALILGRFQPFHLGHLELIRAVKNRYDKIIIAVGSAQEKGTSENPFDKDERMDMIKLGLESAGIFEYDMVCIDDIDNDEKYVTHVESIVPEFNVIYSGNDLVLKLFKQAGYLTKRFDYVNREEWNGTSIRKMMLEGGEWKSMLQPEVSTFIDKIK